MMQAMWLWLMACDVTRFANLPPVSVPREPGETEVTGETAVDTQAGSGVTGDTGATPVPTRIRQWRLLCVDDDTWELYVETEGLTDGVASVFMMNTDVSSVPTRGEQHVVPSVLYDPKGSAQQHSVRLQDGVADWEPGASTAFDCNLHSFAGIMTWLLRVNDRDGVLADCVAMGDDAQGLIDGDYAKVAGDALEAPEQLKDCVAVPL